MAKRGRKKPKESVNPFKPDLATATKEVAKLESQMKAGQKQVLEKIDRARRRRDQAHAFSSMADAAHLSFDQERTRAQTDIARARSFVRHVNTDKRARQKQYKLAKAELDRAATEERKRRSALTSAQQAVVKIEAEIASAKAGVSGLPDEIRRLRQSASELGEKIDVGLKVRRYDLQALANQLKKTTSELARLTKPGLLKQRLRRLQNASAGLEGATAALARAQDDLNRWTASLVKVQQKTHRAPA